MNALTESARAFIPRARERSRYERFHPLGTPDAEQVTERPESNGQRLITDQPSLASLMERRGTASIVVELSVSCPNKDR